MTCWKLKCWRKRRRSKRLTLNFHIPWKMYSNTCSIFIQNHKFYLFICRCKMFIHTHIKHVINIWAQNLWAGMSWLKMDSNVWSLWLWTFWYQLNRIFLDKLSNSTAQEAFCTSNNFWTVSLLAGYKILLQHLPNFSWNHFSWGVSGETEVIARNCSRINTNCK
jgi:hypothetical protein